MRGTNFWTGLAGVIVGALLVSALPATAQDAETNALPGDPFLLGRTNIVNANTALRGGTDGSNLVIRNSGDGVPLNLITNQNGEPPMKVDSRRLVRNLNADQLDFRQANELIRAAYDSTDDAEDANGAVVTATITAPKPGILIMGGSIEARGSLDDYICQLAVDGVTVTGSQRVAQLHSQPGDHTDNLEENCSTDGGAVVAAGDHTVKLLILARESATFKGASVWVIWVPFDGQGNVPSP